jgi:poly-gamma-glutamate capsule biosynthesis protein CapA/YwtB (metallophosphatase superfamily)
MLGQEPHTAKQNTEVPAKTSSAPPKPADTSGGTIRIFWVGDIVMEVPWRQQAVPPGTLFDGVREHLKSADLVIGNLESPLTDWTEPTPNKDKAAVEAGKDVILRVSSPEAAPALADAGIKVVGLANNHVMDFTEHGLMDTLERLRKAGVLFAGAGEADHPGIATAKEADRVVAAVRRARPKVDILIMVFHWGTQFVQEPIPRQVFLAQEAQRAGADLVLGAHPHVLQGAGCIGRAPVVYSAGNFVFPTMSAPTRRTAIFEFEFSGDRTISVRLVPAVIDEHGAPQLVSGEARQDILDEMTKLSKPLGLQFNEDSGTCSDAAVPAPVAPAASSPPA